MLFKHAFVRGSGLLAFAMLSVPTFAQKQGFVHLRIEGEDHTIYEAPIYSQGMNITTPSGGTHLCDGTNNGANPSPGATSSTALAQAAAEALFPFDGTFSSEFDDYFITSIGDSSQTSTMFWGLLNNWQFTPTGGCEFQPGYEDEVLWAFDAFNQQYFLKLTGPPQVQVGVPFNVTVTDGMTGTALSGATVHGQTTDSNGQATFTVHWEGVHTFKARRASSLRSNRLTVVASNVALSPNPP